MGGSCGRLLPEKLSKFFHFFDARINDGAVRDFLHRTGRYSRLSRNGWPGPLAGLQLVNDKSMNGFGHGRG